MSAPLVSIITPAFNNASTLRETADSVLSQTYEQWEWIIVDNGSSDDTSTILSELNDPRIQVIRLPQNLGVSGGLNAGLDQAKGDFLCFLDADDRLTKESISARMELMASLPEVAFVDGAVRRIDMLGTELEIVRPSFDGIPFDELLSLSGKCFIGITW